jgi:hypothetical protein
LLRQPLDRGLDPFAGVRPVREHVRAGTLGANPTADDVHARPAPVDYLLQSLGMTH